MNNAYGINTSKIQIGDRVKVSGVAEYRLEAHWGEVIGKDSMFWLVRMDEPSLELAMAHYVDETTGNGYFAGIDEVVEHTPAGATHITPEGVTVQQPKSTPVVVRDIMDTLDYLKERTGTEWVAMSDGIQLDISAQGDYAGTIHIKFVKKESV